jgi:hypothetical protein
MPIPRDCNEGKHFFTNSEFCDRCDIDFDGWYAAIIEETRKDVCLYLLTVLQSVVNEQASNPGNKPFFSSHTLPWPPALFSTYPLLQVSSLKE